MSFIFKSFKKLWNLRISQYQSMQKLFLSLESPATFDESFKVTSALFFIPDFKLLSCELENVTS